MVEPLRVRVARALQNNPDLTCTALAKMFKTRTGTVCGTPTWKEHMIARRKAGKAPPLKYVRKAAATKSETKPIVRPKILAQQDKILKAIGDLDKRVLKAVADIDKKVSSLL